ISVQTRPSPRTIPGTVNYENGMKMVSRSPITKIRISQDHKKHNKKGLKKMQVNTVKAVSMHVGATKALKKLKIVGANTSQGSSCDLSHRAYIAHPKLVPASPRVSRSPCQSPRLKPRPTVWQEHRFPKVHSAQAPTRLQNRELGLP
ncbi:hypothetical protein J0S82_002789, partial [Galemys pyrenaicus]